MNICVVICEFNPFHNGHQYFLEQVRKNGATHIIAIMSGNFLQRGDVAILSKWARTKQAIDLGADLVIELPVTKATACAEHFALGGVQLAKAIGCVNTLAFGSECGNIYAIEKLAKILLSAEFTNEIKLTMQNGSTYAAAAEKVITQKYSPQLATILKSPNNTLGVEYIKAILKLKANITPMTISRTGPIHDSNSIEEEFASASYIRTLLFEGKTACNFMPSRSYDILKNEINNNRAPASINNIEQIILYKLRCLTKEQIKLLPYVTEGLENRIYDSICKGNSLKEVIESIKTKRYTHARIRRIILCAFLDITKELEECDLEYIRVLGFNKKGIEILKIAKTTSTLPIISKVTSGYNQLNEKGKQLLNIDLKASDLYGLSQPQIQNCGLDYTNELYIK